MTSPQHLASRSQLLEEEPVSFIGDPLALIRDLLAFIGDPLALIRNPLAIVRHLLAPVGGAFSLGDTALPLAEIAPQLPKAHSVRR